VIGGGGCTRGGSVGGEGAGGAGVAAAGTTDSPAGSGVVPGGEGSASEAGRISAASDGSKARTLFDEDRSSPANGGAARACAGLGPLFLEPVDLGETNEGESAWRPSVNDFSTSEVPTVPGAYRATSLSK